MISLVTPLSKARALLNRGRGKRFSFPQNRPDQPWFPSSPPFQWVQGFLFRTGKRPGRESDHSSPSSAETKNEWSYSHTSSLCLNPLNPELNPICYLLALLGAHHFLHVSRIRVKLLTFRLLMSYIYIWSTHS